MKTPHKRLNRRLSLVINKIVSTFLSFRRHFVPDYLKQTNRYIPKPLRRFFSVIVLLIVIALFFAPIFSSTVIKSFPVAFNTQTISSSSLELGITQTKQNGTNGDKKIIYSEPKSLFNFIFGGGMQNHLTEIKSTIVKQPTNKIVANGTKKYQYMYCSNGSYRYYTDTQFKNPATGFTHKSPDYCAKNNEGTETQLSNQPPSTQENYTGSQNQIASTRPPGECGGSTPYFNCQQQCPSFDNTVQSSLNQDNTADYDISQYNKATESPSYYQSLYQDYLVIIKSEYHYDLWNESRTGCPVTVVMPTLGAE